MELREILAISGMSGLYKFVARSTSGLIVEAIDGGRRTNVPGNARVSALSEISVFTDEKELPLAEVFTKIYAHTGGAAVAAPKDDAEGLKSLMGKVLPDYDRERVHVSDMKKIFAWFDILVGAGFTEFRGEE